MGGLVPHWTVVVVRRSQVLKHAFFLWISFNNAHSRLPSVIMPLRKVSTNILLTTSGTGLLPTVLLEPSASGGEERMTAGVYVKVRLHCMSPGSG